MANCPSCAVIDVDKSIGLRHIILNQSLAALECPQCNGVLISVVSYRQWREHSMIVLGSESTSIGTNDNQALPFEVLDSAKAIQCTKCSRIMTKYALSATFDNRLDYCASCEDIWLDLGEWELIENFVGAEHLAKVLTRPWQRALREDKAIDKASKRLKQQLGTDYEKYLEIHTWIQEHPERELILAQLRLLPEN